MALSCHTEKEDVNIGKDPSSLEVSIPSTDAISESSPEEEPVSSQNDDPPESSQNGGQSESDNPITSETPGLLINTSWKLLGIVDSETGSLSEIEPKDCAECYTLTFDTETTARGKSMLNHVFLTRLNPIEVHCGSYASDCIGGSQKCNYYCELLNTVSSYEVHENELKLYFNGKNYLLFKTWK